jgi:signal transduction histidine kinase
MMPLRVFRQSPQEQVRLLRRLLPPLILAVVVLYQLFVVRRIHELGAVYHYTVEILFYGLVGPIVTWGVLTWIERQLREKEQAEARAAEEKRRREHAVVEERARIAREIHEGVAQNLYFLGLQLDLCRKLINKDPQRARCELGSLQALLQDTIEDLRRLIWALRPVELEELGPIEAVRRLALDLKAQVGLGVEVHVQGEERRFPPEVEGALYRIAQEALNNVAKHAGAQHAQVSFEITSERVQVTVEDDGRGFDVAHALREGQGLGLRHLRERIAELSGEFTVESSPGAGTRLRAILPLRPAGKGKGKGSAP